jgi:alkylation response protein AidB-like acyl-CoA dehydrogenase
VKFRFEFHCAIGEDGSLGATMSARVSTSRYQVERLLREVLVTRIALASEKLIRSFIAERMLEPPKSC